MINPLYTRYENIANFFKRTAWANAQAAADMVTPEFKQALIENAKAAANACRGYRELMKDMRDKEENEALMARIGAEPNPWD